MKVVLVKDGRTIEVEQSSAYLVDPVTGTYYGLEDVIILDNGQEAYNRGYADAVKELAGDKEKFIRNAAKDILAAKNAKRRIEDEDITNAVSVARKLVSELGWR